MSSTLRNYGAGIGIPLGAGIGGTAAVVTGQSGELALLAGYGVAGGLLTGMFVGQFADNYSGASDWASRVFGVAVLVSLLVGTALGLLVAWSLDAAFANGAAIGAIAGVSLGILVGGIFLTSARTDEKSGQGRPGSSEQ
jgi:hypothetical protein